MAADSIAFSNRFSYRHFASEMGNIFGTSESKEALTH